MLIKVQGIVRRFKARTYANQYTPKLENDDLFFFNNTNNYNKLGDGSEKVRE